MSLRAALAVLLLSASMTLGDEVPTAAQATDELLGFLPAHLSGCVVIEDLSTQYQQFLESTPWQRFSQLPLYQQWDQSEHREHLEHAVALLESYFGMDLLHLRDRILGKSVILAFRPPASELGEPTGVIACRAIDEASLAELVEAVTRPVVGRTIRREQYRGVDYYARSEGGRQDCLAAIGPVGILTASPATMKQVIDAHKDGTGLAANENLRAMRRALPQGCLLQLWIDPRGFDDVFAATVPDKPAVAVFYRSFCKFWSSLRWTALTVDVRDGWTIGWHWEVDRSRLSELGDQWFELVRRESTFWQRVPADAMLVLTTEWDFPWLGAGLGTIAELRGQGETRFLTNLFSQLLVGFKPGQDVLAQLGPSAGVVITADAKTQVPHVIAAIEFRDLPPPQEGGWSLSTAMEFALRPMLVMLGVEHNLAANYNWMVRTRVVDDLRIHYLSGGKLFPDWFQPGFAVHDGYIVLGNDPEAIVDWYQGQKRRPFSESEGAGLMARRFTDPTFAPKLYVNIRELRRSLDQHRQGVADLLASAQDATPEVATGQLDKLLQLAQLFDHAVIGTQGDGTVRHWMLALMNDAPADDSEATQDPGDETTADQPATADPAP